MELTPEELEAASAMQQVVYVDCLQAIAGLPDPPNLGPEVAVLATIDGLIAATAMTAEASGMFPTLREKRRFADQCSDAMLKSMKEARSDLDAGGQWTGQDLH